MPRRKEDDPLVGWIYKQPKDELVELYKKYFKKPEDYKVEELRKRLKTLIKENKELGHKLANDYKVKGKKSKVKTDPTDAETQGGSTASGGTEPVPSTSGQAREQDPKPEERDTENPEEDELRGNSSSGSGDETDEEEQEEINKTHRYLIPNMEHEIKEKFACPEKFNGKGSIQNFFDRFEQCAESNGWQEVQKARNLPLYLTEAAQRFYKAIIKTKPNSSYEEQKQELFERYKRDESIAAMALQRRTLKKDENLLDYFAEMLELCDEVDPNMGEKFKALAIKNGLTEEVRCEVTPSNPTTIPELRKAMEAAIVNIAVKENIKKRREQEDLETLRKKLEDIKLGKKEEAESALFNEVEKAVMKKLQAKDKINKIKGKDKKEKKGNDRKDNYKDNNKGRKGRNERKDRDGDYRKGGKRYDNRD